MRACPRNSLMKKTLVSEKQHVSILSMWSYEIELMVGTIIAEQKLIQENIEQK